jgi:hypothetical protein
MMTGDFERTGGSQGDRIVSPATRLLTAVIVKSVAETLFLGTVVALAAFTYFSPALRGKIDEADATHLQGWVYDPWKPAEKLVVQLYVDDQFVASTRADASAKSAPYHGFHFLISPKQFAPGIHRAQVYAVRKTPRGSRTLLPVDKEKRTFDVAN